MKFYYNKHANKPGIYKIVNTHNGRIYIGQASQFKERWSGHKKNLRRGKYSNKFILNDFNKCQKLLGHDDFLEFHVLEAMAGSTKAERNMTEEKWIAQYYDGQQQCYNFAKKSDALPRSIHSNDPDVTKKILSEKSKAMWANPATRKKILKRKEAAMKMPEYKEALDAGLKKAWAEPGRRERTSNRMKEAFASGYMDHVIETLKEAQPRGRATFKKRMKRDIKMKQGYQERGRKKIAKIQQRYMVDPKFRKTMDAHSRRNIIVFNESRELTKKPDLIGPDGTVYQDIRNLSAFAKKHGLDPSCAYKLVNGKLKKHRNWRVK